MLKFRSASQLLCALRRQTVLKSAESYICKMATSRATCVKETCPRRKRDSSSVDPVPCSKSTAAVASPLLLPSEPSLPTPTTLQFYRKPLPETCIPFASDEGKHIFREALATEHMNCYFRLASQFRTQDEPAYCGLATLVMVLNALEIDPGRVWKGPWKWYHEDMLDCCIPTELVRKQGITFDEFVCLANCNSLDTDFLRADDSAREEAFRQLVMSTTTKDDVFLIVSYSRPGLGQTGDGHFAPVSGYHPGRDLVLILDTARFKYPPHWVSLPLLFRSMQAVDQETGLPRGYITVRPSRDSKALLLFKISDGFSVNSAPETVDNYQAFLSTWMRFLKSPTNSADGAHLDVVISETLQGFLSFALKLSAENIVLTTQRHIRCVKTANVQCVVGDLLTSLEETPMFKAICREVEKLDKSDIIKLENIFGKWSRVSINEAETGNICRDTGKLCREKQEGRDQGEPCDLNQDMCLSHFVTMFLLSWPYGVSFTDDAISTALLNITHTTLNRPMGQYLKEEVSTLRRQLKKLMGYHSPSVTSP